MKATRGWSGCIFGLHHTHYRPDNDHIQLEVEISERKLVIRLLSWRQSAGKTVEAGTYSVSECLLVKTALLLANLIPAAIYADALQEEIPEAEWAAQQLREWAKWADK